MVTLQKIKEHLRIDFNDIDEQLNDLLKSAIDRAENISGVKKEAFTHDIDTAIINDVASMYQNEETDEKSTIVYRQRMKNPMF